MNSQDNIKSGYAVRVECLGNPSPHFNPQEIMDLFQNQAGCHVVHAAHLLDDGKRWIRLSFNEEDEQRKALMMTGFPIGGATIQVTPLSMIDESPLTPKPKSLIKSKRGVDNRRNLYVLNLPHDLSEQAYRELFTPHGTPTHVVLLKTHDSCSRRRGFVVMSTHQEAQQVIRWLDGVFLRGFQLRVTWANIDRSNGFLSGYDRLTLGSTENASVPSPLLSSLSCKPRTPTTNMDVHTIVASNIPSSVFPTNEIDILFKPFGNIKSIQVFAPASAPKHTLSNLVPVHPLAQTAIVTYMDACDAIAAKNTLHGQVYEGFTLAVGFVANLGNEENQVPKSASLNPLACSTNSAARYIPIPLKSAPVLSATPEHPLRGLPLAASYEPIPFQYSTSVPVSSMFHDNWTPYSANMPQVPFVPQAPLNPQAPFNYQLSESYAPQVPAFHDENIAPHSVPRQKQTANPIAPNGTSFMAYLTHQAATRG